MLRIFVILTLVLIFSAIAQAAPITITTNSPLTPAKFGVAYFQTLTATGGNPPLTWTIISGALPPGLLLSSAGVVSGTPVNVTGTFSITVQASDSVPADTAQKVLTIDVPPVITTTTLPDGLINSPYSQTIATVPTTGTSLTWSISTGSLPAGLAINASTGTISGKPTSVGTASFTVQAVDTGLQSTTASLSITIQPTLTIPTATLPVATVGVFYAQQLVATGPPSPTWSFLSGVLPPGFSLSSTGIVSGQTSTSGSFSFTVQAATTSPAQTAQQSFIIVVNPVATLNITTTGSYPNGAVGLTYSQGVFANGGTLPYTFSVQSGSSLPSGLSISASGTISGTPTTAGTFNFTIAVTDSSTPPASASGALTILIQPQVTITTNSLPLGVVNAFYSLPIAATGPPPLSWTIVSGITPPGLSLTTTGTLSGTPAIAGTFNFTVQASSSASPVQTATKALSIVINPALTITTISPLPNATLGAQYSATLVATGGLAPYTWTVQGAGMPTGFSLSSAGVVSGTPPSPGVFSFTVQVSDSFTPVQQASATFVISVGTTVTITTTSLPDAIQNIAYSQQLQATGTAPFFWGVTSGTLPAGITLSQGGLLQGTATAVGSQTFSVTVTDARSATSTQAFTLTVDPPISTLSITSLPANLNPTQVFAITMTLAASHPSALTGELMMTFTSTAEVPSDDPATQFSSGSRTVNFTIAANTTTATFTNPPISLLTGTVAGTITLTANFDNGPQNVPVGTTSILVTPPQMTSVTAVRTGGGIQVQIVGYASSRRVTSVDFTFDLKNGSKSDLSENVDSNFAAWFQSPVSVPFGSAFSFVQSFNVTGDATQILDVTVRLTNAQGTTTSAVIKF